MAVYGQQKSFVFDFKGEMGYLVYTPQEYGLVPNQQWPLMIFLHGAGERGDDIERVKMHGPPKIAATQPNFPFVVVSPQCAAADWWTDDLYIKKLNKLLDLIIANYKVDTDRVYLTGLSMGGYGTWKWSAKNPERFAAILPICGGGDPETVKSIKDMPAWVFHGAKDDVVPLAKSEEMVEALKQWGNTAKFTVYPDAEHDSWTETYNNPEVYQWLLQHKKRR